MKDIMKTGVVFLLTYFIISDLYAQTDQRPNIIVIMADDLGFSDLGCYGGEIETPNLDRLADDGLKFTQFYNTGRCWPTRTSLLTGYYPQSVRMDPPQKTAPEWVRMIPDYLEPAGYRSYHSGKWHVFNMPSPVKDGGFDHSYLFNNPGDFFSSKHHKEDDKPLPQAEGDFYATSSITDYGIKYIKEHQEKYADQPFFLYMAHIAPHFPLHALQKDIDMYREMYNIGWDKVRQQRNQRIKELLGIDVKLPELEPEARWHYQPDEMLMDTLGAGEVLEAVPWVTLTNEQKDFQSMKMAIHAAMVHRMDLEIGRLIDQLKELKIFENTFILFLSDNGASAEILVRAGGHRKSALPGSSESYLSLGPGWATASNTPFRRSKIWTHEGGVATPFIAHWPNGIKEKGEIRTTVGHVVDFVPTFLDLAGIDPEKYQDDMKMPEFHGKSLVPALSGNSIDRDHLYFNHQKNRALRINDWKVVSSELDDFAWSLFNLAEDRNEKNDLKEKYPGKLRMMVDQWNELDSFYQKLGEKESSGN